MASVNKDIALRVIENDGYYSDDPRVYAVLTYLNNWGSESWAIVSEGRDLARYYASEFCKDVKIKWCSDPLLAPVV